LYSNVEDNIALSNGNLIHEFSSAIEDFPTLCKGNSLTLKQKLADIIGKHFNLHFSPQQKNCGLNCKTFFQNEHSQIVCCEGEIDTKYIIRMSEIVHGMQHCDNLHEVIQAAPDQHQNSFAQSHPSLLKHFIPYTESGLAFRKKGFKFSTLLYLSILKHYQPYLYSICFNIAQQFSNKEEYVTALNIVSVHEDEKAFASQFLVEFNKQQVEHKAAFPLIVFLNGQDENKLYLRTQEIAQFIKQQTDESSYPIFAFVAQINQWRMGLKLIPVVVALMRQLRMYPARDEDFAINFFDADILAIKNQNNLQKKADVIANGSIFTCGFYQDDEPLLAQQNINYWLVSQIHRHMLTLIINRKRLQEHKIPVTELESAPLRFRTSAANAAFSAIFYQLMGGLKAFSQNEILDLSKVMSTGCRHVFHCNSVLEAKKKNLFWTPENREDNLVIGDGGAVIRSMELGVPIIEQYNVLALSKRLVYALTPIDHHKPNQLNVQRIRQEVEFILAKFLGYNVQLIGENTGIGKVRDWPDELKALLQNQLKKLENYISVSLLKVAPSVTFSFWLDTDDTSISVLFQGKHSQVSLADYTEKYQLSFFSL